MSPSRRVMRPDSLEGAFLSIGTGFSFPWEETASGAAAGTETNPWLTLASVVDRCRSGDFSWVSLLPSLATPDAPADLLQAVRTALARIAPAGFLESLLGSLDESIGRGAASPTTLDLVFATLAGSGLLWTVPRLLELIDLGDPWVTTDRVLRACGRIVGVEVPAIASRDYSAENALAEIQSTCERLRAHPAATDQAFLGGKPLSINALVRSMLEQIPAAASSGLLTDRIIFEAFTGVDCTPMYVNRIFQPLAASAILEDFLEAGEADKFAPGVRYFFGHRIPD